MPSEITMHSQVLMHYSIALVNGTIVESSFDDEPVEIIMGNDDLPETMALAIYGLKVGDHQTLTLTPEQCFGEHDEDNIHMMPLSDFPQNLEPEIGVTYNFGTPEGDDITGTIRNINNNQVEVDFNHPLAGHALIFTVEILDVNNTHTQEHYDDTN